MGQLKIAATRKQKVSALLYDIVSQFSICLKLPQQRAEKIVVAGSGIELVGITKHDVASVVSSLTDSVFKIRSSLQDSFVSMDDIATLAQRLKTHIKRLDHIGFCYTISSQEDERKRIIEHVSKTAWHLYEMESVDLAKWYFIGDTARWQDPMIELLPVEKPKESPEDFAYWMPHIHIDINTSLSADEIIAICTTVLGGTRTPILYTDPQWGTHCVRIWLGVVAGVNFQLDLSTKVRNLQWVRNTMLKQLL